MERVKRLIRSVVADPSIQKALTKNPSRLKRRLGFTRSDCQALAYAERLNSNNTKTSSTITFVTGSTVTAGKRT